MSKPITVHGVDYASVEAMPPDVRAEYEAQTQELEQMLAEARRGGGPSLGRGTAGRRRAGAGGVRFGDQPGAGRPCLPARGHQDLAEFRNPARDRDGALS